MSTIKLISKNIWAELTRQVKQSKNKSMVAVAYFAQNAARMLPLKKGSILIVDASIKNLKSGSTCPDELLKLYYNGVHIYSQENLHAKIYIIGNHLYCGSANVSPNSANNLKEALLKTNNKDAIIDAKAFINSFCRIELGEEEIIGLKKYYNPPKDFGGTKMASNNSSSNFHIVNLRLINWSEKEIEEAEKGRKIANQKLQKKSRHRIDEFSWGSEINFKVGDTILQITKDAGKKLVTPIGKLIHIRKWSNGKKTKHICFVEVPEKRRKNLKYLLNKLEERDAKSIKRGGRKRVDLQNLINKLWSK